jgi:uncharacterized protein (TIGR00375 family)
MKKIAADLHLHSSFARATSKDLSYESLSKWAKLKGIGLLSSADFTHPVWFEETKEKLTDLGNGFFEFNGVKFVLGAEVSCIFSQGGKLRRVHLLLFAPSLKAVEKINKTLGEKGKLGSDGRPILGLTAKNVLETVLEADEDSFVIPAHIWTPWFGVLGQNGGFNSLKECFEDLTAYIYGVETGLSSDPAMNWRIKELDKIAILSFSDAHSPAKMGRELTIFKLVESYQELLTAIKKQNFDSTIEFFPEEGKYHFNGHRKCNFVENPSETLKRSLVCPVCHKPLTIGVVHRVETLAEKDRGEGFDPGNRPSFRRLVGLQQIISEITGSPISSKKVVEHYLKLTKQLSSELTILNEVEENLLEKELPRLGEAVSKVRKGDIYIEPGFDGVYGVVNIWPARVKEKPKLTEKVFKKVDENGQIGLFEN